MELVLKQREKIFKCKKFDCFGNILDEMNIPENFDTANCIPKIFSNPDYESIKRFVIEPYKSLYDYMRTYAKPRKIEKINNIILLVHPFYPLLRL